MICWRVSHKYKLVDHIERKDIGIYSSLEKAENAIASLKTKSGFKDTARLYPEEVNMLNSFTIKEAKKGVVYRSIDQFIR